MSFATTRNEDKYILLVDDEEVIRDLTSEMLASLKYNIFTASNGQEALDIYLQQPQINLVATDIKMPLMNGVVLVEKLRELNADVKIIVVSGLLEDDTIKRLTELKVDKIMEKPFTADEYLKVIAALI